MPSTVQKPGKKGRRTDIAGSRVSSGDESDHLDSDEPRKKRRVGQRNTNEEEDNRDSSEDSDDNDSDANDSSDENGNHGAKLALEEAPKISIPTMINPPSRVRRRENSSAVNVPTAAAISATDSSKPSGTVLTPTDPNTTFGSLGVRPWLVQSLANMAIHRPTSIQKGCIPAILSGDDCIGGSRTGSGKTVAFAVPVLQAWATDPSAIFALVLTPTRELALQIYEQFLAISAPQPLKAVLVTGGADMRAQATALARRPHIVIATPGRLADHIRTSGEDTVCGLRRVRFVVLDEADRLLAGGEEGSGSMLPDVEECLGALPPPGKRQTLLFTATVTPEVRALKTMPRAPGRPPVFVCEVETQAPAIPTTLRQLYLDVPVTHREHYLHVFLSTTHNEALPAVIIFCNRTATAAYLHHLLRLLGHRVTALHGKLPQRQRTDNLGRFRAAAARILVATDVAARGLDIPDVALVVNYDVPRQPDDYIHRVGRTARAGRTGEAVTFVGQRDVDLVLAIEARVGRPMELWQEEGVNLETRVLRDALKVVSEKKREALLEIEENREVGGKRKRGMQKLRAT
ncbi:ATP dependent RNA helicase [Grosmannia clavigera kw1407]|uniref:ATP dependent RNA helicase n=1 Tax=Grosmannia clavigera (strain kw1407 / UAMH 11150) TaxID=655863 RepID=F0XUB8_GROCL|nr:ATP dependent RNA helicase [Grosmannia clavigera kw1407]EFW98613.1 ATP dependent RNA helicase [Grosmannia clavigera kw1407]